MGLGVGVRVRWFQLPRRRGQGQRGRTGIRVPGGALVSAREPAPGVRSRRGTSRERPGRLSPGRVERLGSLGGSMAQEAGKGFGKPKPWGQGAPPGQDHGGHPDLWREEDTQQRDRPQHGGTVRGQLREDGHAGSGVPASPGAHGHAGRLTHSGCRDLGSRTNRRQREVGRAVGGAGVMQNRRLRHFFQAFSVLEEVTCWGPFNMSVQLIVVIILLHLEVRPSSVAPDPAESRRVPRLLPGTLGNFPGCL